MRNIARLYRNIVFLHLLGVLVLFMTPDADASRVALLIDREQDAYTQTQKSIVEYLHDHHPETIIVVVNPFEDKLPDDVDVLVPLGSKTAFWAKEHRGNRPVVFCLVLNPVQSGLIDSIENPGVRISGVTLDIPANYKLDCIRQLLPNVKRIGVLGSEGKLKAFLHEESDAIRAAGFELIAIPVTGPSEFPDGLEKIVKSADMLWMIPDANIYNTQTVRYMIPLSIRFRLPVLALSKSYIEPGALAAFTWSFSDIGQQVGELVTQIIAGDDTTTIPVESPQKITIAINFNTAQKIGVTIPPALMDSVEFVRR